MGLVHATSKLKRNERMALNTNGSKGVEPVGWIYVNRSLGPSLKEEEVHSTVPTTVTQQRASDWPRSEAPEANVERFSNLPGAVTVP